MTSSWFSNISLQATMQQLAGELAEEFSDFSDLQSQLTKSMGEASNLISNVNNLDILNLDEMAVQEEVDAAILEDGECDEEYVEAGEDDEDEEEKTPAPKNDHASKTLAPVPTAFLSFDDPLFGLPEIEVDSSFVEVSSQVVAPSPKHTIPSEQSAVAPTNIIAEIHDNYIPSDYAREEVTSLDLEYEQYESQRTHIADAEEEKAAISPKLIDSGTAESDRNLLSSTDSHNGEDKISQPTVIPPIAAKAVATAMATSAPLPALTVPLTHAQIAAKDNLESVKAVKTPVEKVSTGSSSIKPAGIATKSDSVPAAKSTETNKSARSKALKPLKPRAKTTKNLDFWGIDSGSKGNKSAVKSSNDKSSSNSNGSTHTSSGMANVSLLFDPMGLNNDDELVDVSLETSTPEAVVEGNANSIPNQSVSSAGKDADVSKPSSVSASSLSAIVGQFLAPQRIVVGLSITQTFSYFDNVDEEIDLEADPILNQVKKNLSQPSTETTTSSAANYALNMLKSYAFSNSAALTRDPYSYFYKESPNDLEQAPSSYGSSSSGSIQTSSTGKSSANTTVYWFRNRPVLNWCRRKLNMLCNRARDVFIVLYLRLSAGVMYIVESISQGSYYCLGRIANPIQSVRDVHTYFVTELFTSEGQPQSGGTLRWLVRTTTSSGLFLMENMTLTNFVLIVLAMVFFYVFWKFGRYSIDPTGSTVLAKSVTKQTII
eukprot:gene26895-35590_t